MSVIVFRVADTFFQGGFSSNSGIAIARDGRFAAAAFRSSFWFPSISHVPFRSSLVLQPPTNPSKNRDTLSRCGSCVETPGCRFCVTTHTCLPDGDPSCHDWALDAQTCPRLITCDYTSCATCALSEGCAWCGDSNECVDLSETPFLRCQGEVRFHEQDKCPYAYAETTSVDGNLVVAGDADVGGGV